ncbi:ABA4-like family protein [Negadavirga shengliensis]|uniref:ABA4-like family protein n=1 Tax=Negadavirga shengliensis TaxID=1389218 RepID=A0ABV9SYK9_9BACT
METIFSIASTAALFSWIVLFIFYRNKWVYVLLFSGVIFLLALLYLYFIIQGMGNGNGGGFGSLAEVATLFQKEEALLAGWIHYLAFDLFVGMWICKDAMERSINRWLVLPCLFFTFMLGPVGLLLYLIVRSVKSKTFLQSPYHV